MILNRNISLAILFMVSMLIVSKTSAQRKKNKTTLAQKETIVITENQASLYRIVLPAFATENEKKSAEVLQDYLLQISGAALPILHARKDTSQYEILLGQNDRLGKISASIDFHALGDDGFVIKTEGTRLIIAGGRGKGTLYGVYTFLEKYLDCRMYSATVKQIPSRDKIELEKIDDTQIPVTKFRYTHYRGTWHSEYTNWHKLSHDENGNRTGWGSWAHTFNSLVPPRTYYDEHPEYYSEVRGKRIPTQLCLTHPDVLQIATRNLRRRIAANPEAKYWSVSQNDNRDYCTCANCKAIDEREGSPSGSMINFVNQIADEFPDKIISTLAYEYSRHAPRSIKPRDNVNIMLCSIEINRDKPIDEDSTSTDFATDVIEWGKIANDIIVWDYIIQFNHLVSPFPNLHVLQPNLQFFAKNGVSAMFAQGNREVGGEFAELRSYLISKLLWNPFENVDSLMNDFLRGFYGAAAPVIRTYIDEMTEALLLSGKPLRIFGSPMDAEKSYLTPERLARYNSLFEEAEARVKDHPEILERVRIARLPLRYAMMEQSKKHFVGKHGVFQQVDGMWKARADIRAMIDPFTDLLIRQGVTQLKEWSTSPEEYRSAMYRLLAQGMNEHLAFGKPVTFISPEPSRLPANAAWILTNGIRASHDYDYNWLAFWGQDLEVIIDLEEVKEVRRIESAYYQFALWLRILPKNVEYFLSDDGQRFTSVGVVENTLPIDQYGALQRDFILEFEPRKARYIKVKATSIGDTPAWHPGGGRTPNILIDEIVVE